MDVRASRHGKPEWYREWTTWVLVALIAGAATYVFWDIDRPFNQTDEFLYATATKEMIRSGDYLTPRFADVDLLTKPPLFYWLSAPFVAGIGDLEIAMRLLPGMSFLAAVLLVFLTVRRCWSPALGLLAALIYTLCYDHQFNHVYKSGVMEGLLNALMILVLWLNLQLKENPGRIRWIAAALALALLLKSAFVLFPAAITAANLWMNRRVYRLTWSMAWQSAALFAAIALPWFLTAIAVHGSHLFDYMFVDQVYRRAVNDTATATATGRTFGRKEDLYVLRHFLEYGQPWSLLVWPAVWSAVRRWREDDDLPALLLRLCCGWFVLVMLVFLIARGKWSWYISSAYIPASILIAAMFADFWRHGRMTPWVWAASAAAFVVAHTPFVFNPYSGSSGRFPLPDVSLQQFGIFLAFGLVAVLICRRAIVVGTRAATLLSACVVLGAVAVTTALVLAAQHPVPARAVSMTSAPVAGVMCLALLSLIPARPMRIARAACMAAPFILAAGYLVAPLRWDSEDNRRMEIKFVEGKIATGYFADHSTLEIGPLSFFRFVPIYATFAEEYDVSYDRERRRVFVVRRGAPD